MNLYKFLSLILCGLLIILGFFYIVEKKSHENDNLELNNKLAKLEGMVQETKSSWSSRAIEIENLKSENGKLQKIISKKDEEIVSITETALRWKDKYFDIKDAKETVVGSDGTTIVTISEDCEACLKDLRLRVDFKKSEDYLEISGFTLTNPPWATVNLKWLREIKMSLILTKTKDKSFKAYIDFDNSDIVPAKLNLKVDPSVFEKAWYEKIAIGTDVSVGSGVQTGLKITYDILENVFVGPNVIFQYDGNQFRKLYGVSTGWYIFR